MTRLPLSSACLLLTTIGCQPGAPGDAPGQGAAADAGPDRVEDEADAAVGAPDDAPEQPPLPPPATGLILEPRNGARQRDRQVEVSGLVDDAASAVVVELLDPTTRTWLAVGPASVDPAGSAESGFPVSATVDLDQEQFPDGGLAHLRLVIDGVPLGVVDDGDEAEACLAATPLLADRLTACRSGATAVSLYDPSDAPDQRVRYLDRKGDLDPDETRDYYEAIDAPRTLEGFINRYNMDEDDTAVTVYYNRGDLGIGREMHCRDFGTPGGQAVACYVRNYGDFGGSRQEAIEELLVGAESGNGEGSFATVAMVYEPPYDAPNAVKFMVYNGIDNTLLDEAQLDVAGDNVSIPSNCLNCHGNASYYDEQRREIMFANFLPFDPEAFDFADENGFRLEDQQNQFRAQNQMFLNTSPPPALAELVKGWYGGGENLVGDANLEVIPAAWDTPQSRKVYREVITPYCRGCHSSREDSLSFRDPGQLYFAGVLIGNVVCGNGPDDSHTMPNAEAMLEPFWRSNARALLASFMGAETFGACAP